MVPFTKDNVLFVFNAGDKTLEQENKSDKQIIDEVIAELKVMYPKANPKLIDAKVTRWEKSPISYGSYSFL